MEKLRQCQCTICKGCQCGEDDLPAVKPPQPSGDAVVEPRIAASVKSSETYIRAPIPIMSEANRGIPILPPPTAVSFQVLQVSTPQERIELLEAKAVLADHRNRELQWQVRHLMSRLVGLEARVHHFENPQAR